MKYCETFNINQVFINTSRRIRSTIPIEVESPVQARCALNTIFIVTEYDVVGDVMIISVIAGVTENFYCQL